MLRGASVARARAAVLTEQLKFLSGLAQQYQKNCAAVCDITVEQFSRVTQSMCWGVCGADMESTGR
jgi:hypothetical protein